MGKNEWKTIIRENNDGKRINPIIAFLAFLLGAVVTAFVAVWRIRASKGKKRTKVSDDAVDRDYEAADREMKKLFSVLQRESERRMWGDPETRIAGGYGVSGVNSANVQTQKVKPYIPRKRVSAKWILGRATAVAAAAALVVTGLYLAPYDRTGMPTVQAKSSFGGIKQVVQEHNSENPFVILDVVPGKAYYEINGVKYEFSLGTIGYLAPGQSPIQQDLASIFKGEDGDGNSSLYPYSAREQLITAVKNSGFAEIEYKEAYLGIDGTEAELGKKGWSRIFNSVDVDLSESIVLPSSLNCPTGRITACVTPTKGGEYNLYWGEESLFASSGMSALSSGSYYTFAGDDGNWQLIFGDLGTAVSGYLPTEIDRGSIDELKGKGYSDATGLYAIGADGNYIACGTIGNPLPVPTIEQEETEEPTDPEKPDNPKKPEKPDDPVTDPDDPVTDPDDPVTDPDDPVTDPDDPVTDPDDPVTDPDDPVTDPDDPVTDPVDPPAEEQPVDPPTEEQPADPVDPPAEQEQKNDLMSVLGIAGTGAGWHLYVNMTAMESETPVDPSIEEQPADPVDPPAEEQPIDPPADPDDSSTDPVDTPADPVDSPAQQQPSDPSAEQQQDSSVDTATYYVLKFTYFDYTETEEQEGSLYQITSSKKLSAGETVPSDSYVLGNELLHKSLNKAMATAEAADGDPVAQFLYVGKGNGDYEISRPQKEQLVAELTGASLQEILMQESDEQDDAEQNLQGTVLQQAVGAVYDIEVLNAPVYIKCSSASGSDGLRKFVFNSHPGQDNASNDFAIKVITASADEVTYEMVQAADLVYLEDGTGLGSDSDAGTGKIIEKKYIGEEDGPGDITESAILSLLYGAVKESKPVMVDYGIIRNPNNYAYGDSNYQKLAKAFLKKDLAAFYHEMEKSKDLVGSVLMNVGTESKEYPNKKDNDYHYVNRNVYVINNASLLGENFGNPMDKNQVQEGFTEVLAAIRAENVMLSDDEKISEDVSMAMAVQYIINYSLGLVGEYKDLSILELQPTANTKSDLHRDANDEKERVVLYWQREDQDSDGQQILRSSRMIRTDVTVSSVAAFNSSYQDINADYNMIFIGLDGQRLYRDRNEDGELSAVYNDDSLNGRVYHTGDRVAGSESRYDANDITEQKKEALLDYLRAGYPIVVENDCFKGKSARNAEEKDINTKYIGSDTQMYAFLKEAISMAGSDKDGGESGIGIYTIEDVHSSALFAMQLNALRPKISLYTEQAQDETEVVSDMIATELAPDMPGIYRGTFDYRITSDRMGEDKTYRGNLEKHLYLDLNYDGIFAPEEESEAYQLYETENGGRISVDFNEVNFGIVPWKLEVTDTDNRYRRASTQGCFTISGNEKEKIRVLQILDDTANVDANFQEQYDKKEDSMLAHYLRGAEALLNMNWKIETITPDELAKRLTKNANYLSLWDVVVLGFGESGNPGDAVTAAVNNFITAGGSVLVSSAGASTDKGRLGLSAAVLGQAEGQTYGKLGLYSNSKFRYDGILANMFYKRSGLLVDRVNDGAITRWPYEIGETASLEGTEISMPDYLLDIGTVKEEGQPYATAWFTLIDSNYAGGYSVSPRDGRNNYYVYSKGNVVYVGQSQYPYTYDRKTGDTPDGAGIDECKIFVNALMAAYNGGVHRANVSIVAGFNGVNKVESVTVPFDVAFKDAGDTQGGILGDMVDVYFRFTDNNIAVDKATEVSFYYKNAGAGAEQELLLPDGGINTADFTTFTSPIWAVENHRLVEVSGEIVPGKVYRIKAPLLALQNGDDETSQICVLLTNRYTRAGQSVEALSMDSVSLNRAQMFLLE